MATRSAEAAVRRRALAVVEGLIARLREEYLVSLPPSLYTLYYLSQHY